MSEEVLDRSPLSHQLPGGLFAHPGNAGNVVGAVAHQAEDVDDLLGTLHPPEFAQGGEIDDVVFAAAAPGFPHRAGLGDQLSEILVGGDHEGFEVTPGVGLPGEGADDVVGLVAVQFEDRDVERFTEALEVGEGGGQFLRHVLAVGLVLGKELVAGSGRGGVEGHREVGGLLFFENGQEGVGKPEEGRGVNPLRAVNRVPDQGEMGPVGQCHPVQQEKPLHPQGFRAWVLWSTVSPELTKRWLAMGMIG